MTRMLQKPIAHSRFGMLCGTVIALCIVGFVVAGSARADFAFDELGLRLDEPPQLNSDGSPVVNPDGSFIAPTFTRQAGAHPDLSVTVKVAAGNPDPAYPDAPAEAVRDVDVDLPPGFVGNPNAVPTCLPQALSNGSQGYAACPLTSQIGVAEVAAWAAGGVQIVPVAVYNLAHGPEVPARFGFNFAGAIATITPRVRPGDYGVSSGSFAISQVYAVEFVRLTLWGVPADPSHDSVREVSGPGLILPTLDLSKRFPQIPSRWASTEAPRRPFLTTPTSCPENAMTFKVRGDSWEHPGVFDERVLNTDEDGTPLTNEDCEKLPFAPSVTVQSTSQETAAPTGLKVDLHVPQPQDPDGLATAHVRKVKLTLPQGMAVSPSSAKGLGACSLADIGLGTNDPPSCPQSSKLGTVEINTPVLEEPLEGDVILARQKENPFGSLLALYIAVKGPGFYLKLPGRVDLDPQTGQLTTTFDNNPQLPFEDLHLTLRGGPRAALVTPPTCGTPSAEAEFVSWATDDPVKQSIPLTFDQGCGSGFNPRLNAGSASAAAGAFSPFNLQVVRVPDEPNLAKVEATLPPGLLAKLAGVPLCTDAQATTGDCPAASQVGTTTVGAGPGPLPVYVPEPGKAPSAVYLAGPYKGAPYSLVVTVPAQAGPFDLGTVVVRNALRVDPTTTQVTAESEPLPQILEGIPISYRDVRVEINRPEFTVNPTNCSQFQVTSVLTSAAGQTASPKAPFAAANCERLAFKPTLALKMTGQTKRAGNPALSATLKAPKGQANIANTTVILPKTVFIDQRHVSNPCTRVEFNQGACPPRSVLGTAKAWSPLLDKPLEGPVYFRSNGGERQLPDIVADLNGQIHVVLVGFIDSKKVGKETSLVRTRFASVPDAPVSRFVLELKGGKRSLIQNSADLCKARPKAEVKMGAQNGKTHDFEAPIAVRCGGGKKAKGKKATKS